MPPGWAPSPLGTQERLGVGVSGKWGCQDWDANPVRGSHALWLLGGGLIPPKAPWFWLRWEDD